MHRGLHDIHRPARLCGILFDPKVLHVERSTPFTLSDVNWIMEQVDLGASEAHRMSYEMKLSFKSLLGTLKGFDVADRSKNIELRSLLCSLLLDSAKRMVTERTLEPKLVVQRAVQYMKENMNCDTSLDSLISSVKCSRARLFVLFKESTGMTPNDYWQRLRIERSIELMKDPTVTITDVAFAVGFASSQYFCTVFRKYSGTTPTAFRNADGNGHACD